MIGVVNLDPSCLILHFKALLLDTFLLIFTLKMEEYWKGNMGILWKLSLAFWFKLKCLSNNSAILLGALFIQSIDFLLLLWIMTFPIKFYIIDSQIFKTSAYTIMAGFTSKKVSPSMSFTFLFPMIQISILPFPNLKLSLNLSNVVLFFFWIKTHPSIHLSLLPVHPILPFFWFVSFLRFFKCTFLISNFTFFNIFFIKS